jgi:hypothetical protein
MRIIFSDFINSIFLYNTFQLLCWLKLSVEEVKTNVQPFPSSFAYAFGNDKNNRSFILRGL